MDFSQALDALKRGRKVQRPSWNASGQWVVRQNGYPEGIPLNRNTAQTTGLPEGSTQVFEPYFLLYNAYSQFVPWTPSTGDLNADDWEIYYMPGEEERLRQEETDAILADPELVAELELAGKDPASYSTAELKMAVALRTLEREDLPDREDIRFRLLSQLMRPLTKDEPSEADTSIAGIVHTFVGVVGALQSELTQTRAVLDGAHAKLDDLTANDAAWRDKYVIPPQVTSNDEVWAYQRIRYFQDGWKGHEDFTVMSWRLIATLLAPMLEEWRQSHHDTVGNFDLDRFRVTLSGTRLNGVDKIGGMEMELMPPISPEQVAAVEKALDALADPEATQWVNLQRPQRTRYFLTAKYGAAEVEVIEAEYWKAVADAGWAQDAAVDGFNDGDVKGRVARPPQ